MNKGLEALKRVVEWFEIENVEDTEIIEQELERLEDIDNILNTGGGIWSENGIVSKKLKALEIIKEKSIDLLSLHHAFTMDKEGEESGLEWYNSTILVRRKVYDVLAQEEYDLLKEVML